MEGSIEPDIIEFLSTSGLSEKKLANLRRNLTTAFADSTVCAEIIAYYYPKIICLHNYQAASSTQYRAENWTMLNTKVLKKINCGIDRATILSFASRESFDKVHSFLRVLKHKLPAYEPIYAALQFHDEDEEKEKIAKLSMPTRAVEVKQKSSKEVKKTDLTQPMKFSSKPSTTKTNELHHNMQFKLRTQAEVNKKASAL